MRPAQLLRHQAPEDRMESKVRQLAEARLSPKLPCNPRPTLPWSPLAGSSCVPRSLWTLHPHDVVDVAACTQAKRHHAHASASAVALLSEASHWLPVSSGPAISESCFWLGPQWSSSPRHETDQELSLPITLRSLPLLALWPESSPRPSEGGIESCKPTAGPPCPAHASTFQISEV